MPGIVLNEMTIERTTQNLSAALSIDISHISRMPPFEMKVPSATWVQAQVQANA